MKMVRKTAGKTLLAKREKQIFAAIGDGVLTGAIETENLCPVDKGDLKSTRTVEDDGQGHVTFGIGGQSKVSDMWVSHHVYIEWGTRKMPAQPNYRPGVEAAKNGVRRNLKNI